MSRREGPTPGGRDHSLTPAPGVSIRVNGSATLSGPAGGGEIDFSPSGIDYARLKSGRSLCATINNFGAPKVVAIVSSRLPVP